MKTKLFQIGFTLFTGLTLSLGSFLGANPQVLAQDTSTTASGIQNVQEGFLDLDRTHPYYVPIRYMQKIGVINGYDDGTVKADNPINKAEVTKVLIETVGADLDVGYTPQFPDVFEKDWYSLYALKGYQMGFINGNDGTGTFMGEKQINLAEFLKMMFITYQVDTSKITEDEKLPNMRNGEWYEPYINYANKLGIIQVNVDGTVNPGKVLDRGEVLNILYLFNLLLKGDDIPFLLEQAEAHLAQIEFYTVANQAGLAKNSSELGVQLTQQAYQLKPTDPVVLSAAKIARAYDWLVDAYILGMKGENEAAAQKANEVIDKATEAWEVNNDVQAIAAHVKELARRVLEQVGGTEN